MFLVDFAYEATTGFQRDDALNIIQALNKNFSPARMYFKLGDVYMKSTATPPDPTRIVVEIMKNFSSVGTPPGFLPRVQINKADYGTLGIVMHEFGHHFGLLHVGINSNSQFTGASQCVGTFGFNLSTVPDLSATSSPENVTRDMFVPGNGFNALTAGDQILDTPASFEHAPSCYDGTTLVYNNSTIHLDLQGDQYVNVPVNNYMNKRQASGDPTIPYLDTFTPGQYTRMKQNLFNNLGYWAQRTRPISLLYTPQTGTYPTYPGGPTGNISGDNPLLTPGLTYTLDSCARTGMGPFVAPEQYPFQTSNIVYTMPTFLYTPDTDPDLLEHPMYYAVSIEELDYLHVVDNRPDYFICFDPQVRAIGGRVIRFDDGQFNTNVTVNPKTADEIESSTLINELQSSLYVIEKDLNNGAVEQTTIIKNND